MMATADARPAQETAADRDPTSQVYLLLARCFSFPTKALHEAWGAQAFVDELRALCAALPFGFEPGEVLAPSLGLDDFESEYINTFDLNPRCPLHESSYSREDMSSRDIYEEVVRFYGHFDIKLSEVGRDYHDHLVTELEFMAFLASKQADALRRGGDAAPYQRAQLDFLDRHLCRWTGKLDARARKATRERFYKDATTLLTTLVEAHREHLHSLLPGNGKRDQKAGKELP